MNTFQLACQLFAVVGLGVAAVLMAAAAVIMKNGRLGKPDRWWVRVVLRLTGNRR